MPWTEELGEWGRAIVHRVAKSWTWLKRVSTAHRKCPMGPSNTLLSGHQSYILYACSLCGLWGPICYDGFNYCGYAFTQDWSQAQFAASFCLGPMAAGMLIGGDRSQHGWHSDPGCSPGWCGTAVDRTGSHCGLLRDQYGTTKDFVWSFKRWESWKHFMHKKHDSPTVTMWQMY